MKTKVYGIQSQKAEENFGHGSLPRSVIEAYSEVKLAALRAIQETEVYFSDRVFKAVETALEEIKKGEHDSSFVTGLFQGGAGTSINMNINEVSAKRGMQILSEQGSDETIHPVDDVNRYQSTNDTFGTVLSIVTLRGLQKIEEKIIKLQEALVQLENEHSDVLVTGRTEMQSALPITFGQIFSSWAGMAERDRWRVSKLKERARTVPLGGTAVGTAWPAPASYVFAAEKHLRSITRLPLSRSQNLPDAISHLDSYAEIASTLSVCAGNLFKMFSDILLYSSSMSGEIKLPELQYGSTIMAAKTNPVIPEFIRGLALNVQGEAYKVSLYSQGGQLQLNQFTPFLLNALCEIFTWLETALSKSRECLQTLAIDKEKCSANLLKSDALLNALLPLLGYDAIKDMYHHLQDNPPHSLKQLISTISMKASLSYKTVEHWLDPKRITTFYGEHQ